MASFGQVDRIGEAAAGIHIEFALPHHQDVRCAAQDTSGQPLCRAVAAQRHVAGGAESSRDFVHKLKICLKELNETRVWLKIITRSELLAEDRLAAIIQ